MSDSKNITNILVIVKLIIDAMDILDGFKRMLVRIENGEDITDEEILVARKGMDAAMARWKGGTI